MGGLEAQVEECRLAARVAYVGLSSGALDTSLWVTTGGHLIPSTLINWRPILSHHTHKHPSTILRLRDCYLNYHIWLFRFNYFRE